MHLIESIGWLASQIFSVLTHFWMVSAVLLGITVLSFKFGASFQAGPLRSFIRQSALLAGFPILIFISGVVFAHTDAHTSAPTWPLFLVYGLGAAHVGLAIRFIIRSVPNQLQASCVTVTTLYWSLACLFVSVMSISNDWL